MNKLKFLSTQLKVQSQINKAVETIQYHYYSSKKLQS